MQDSSYEIPDVESVRGLMLGLQNKDSTYETPDTVCVNHFMESVCNAGPDSTDDYEDPTEGGRLKAVNFFIISNKMSNILILQFRLENWPSMQEVD